jgi:hypothetical protein
MRLALILIFLAAPAWAQEQCAPRDRLVGELKGRFGETRVSEALAQHDIIETWANPKTGSWTILRTSPDGRTCMIASGTHYRHVPQGEPV